MFMLYGVMHTYLLLEYVTITVHSLLIAIIYTHYFVVDLRHWQ